MGRAARKTKIEVPRKRVLKIAPPPPKQEEVGVRQDIAAVGFIVLGLFLFAALTSHLSVPIPSEGDVFGAQQSNIMGRVGALLASVLLSLLGWCSYVTVLWSFLLARTVWRTNSNTGAQISSFLALSITVLASLLMTISCATMAAVIFGSDGGGAVGSRIAYTFVRYVNEAGTLLLSTALFLVSLGIATGFGTRALLLSVIRGIRLGQDLSVDIWTLLRRGVWALRRSNSWLVKVLFYVIFYTFAGVRRFGNILLNVLAWLFGRPRRGAQLSLPEGNEQRPFILGDNEALAEGETNDEEEQELTISRRGPRLKKKKKRKGLRLRRIRKSQAEEEVQEEEESETEPEETALQRANPDYELPPLDLLVGSEEKHRLGPDDDELLRNGRRLEETLANFRIGGKVVEIHPGPVITLYQFVPAAGIKVQRVVNLADDLALALKVASVRVYAPVPGKGTVGIEVPNAEREIVRLRDVLEHQEFQNSPAPLTLALGKDTFGEPVVADLSKMPHLLIAGATGTGKSVCINSILLSLLCRNSPEDLRLIMIDPKMLELSTYENIPHLKAPVVTLPKRARAVLWWAVEEMERRYQLMMKLGVRNLAGYNRAVTERFGGVGPVKEKPGKTIIELDENDVIATASLETGLERDHPELPTQLPLMSTDKHEVLPRIVIVVDELADLMLTVGREIEELLTRLAQKARAAGIHLILATQRPSVNVITGLIKANFPARISFKVASKIDARTVLDISGAEKLLGQGDMLFSSPSLGRVRRLHSPFVSDKEVGDVVEWLRGQGLPEFDTEMQQVIERFEESERAGGPAMPGEEEYDPLYDQAVRIVVEKGQASTSMVQRVFRIGYNRAARILEMMERDGIVGPADGAKARPVLVPNRE